MPDPLAQFPMPPHRYVPGQNTRHPEDWFDVIKASVHPGIAPDALARTDAWRAGLVYLKSGYFWECHEVLEAVWMQTPDPSAERDMVQAVIQLANARLKLLMVRPRAALRLCEMVRGHLRRWPERDVILELSQEDILQQTRETEAQAEAQNIAL